MKNFKKILALTLAVLMLASVMVSCKKKETEPEFTYAAPILPEAGQKVYNIIYAVATVPPVLAALDCIDNGYETYAIIERGKTYSGIEQIKNFYNAGFDVASNESSGLSQEKLDTMTAKVKELNSADPNAFFVFYSQDGTALSSAAIAANAGIPKERFHVYMCEDGTGAYVALSKLLTKEGVTPYQSFENTVSDAQTKFNAVMSKSDNKTADDALLYNIELAYGLAALPNFTYWFQDSDAVKSCFNTAGADKDALLAAFGFESTSGESTSKYKLNLRFAKISESVAKLTEEERTSYLSLMYGNYYEDTYNALTRTERAGEKAPEKKLIYIGARHSYYPQFVSNADYGIGGLKEGDKVPESYAALDDKYKSPLLFATESDYTSFLAIINDKSSYSADITEDVKDMVKVAAFNLYVDYIYSLKFAYALHGEEYDIILKGHPREVLGSSNEWGERYKVTYGENKTYVFDSLLDSLLLSFHSSDSTGKYIGTVPYGTAAENLAYLGVEVTICGLPSSTYNGYDPDVDVLFIMALTDESIDGETSQVKDRYAAGTLTYEKNGSVSVTNFYNTGNTYKYAAEICLAKGNTKNSEMYNNLFSEWLKAHRNGAPNINAQGYAVNTK